MTARRQGHLKEFLPGKWCIRVTVGVDAGGKVIRLNKTLNGTKAQAQRYLNAALRRKDDGIDVPLTRQSLGLWIEEWLNVWCGGISPRTKSDYERLLKRYLPIELRARQLPLITASEVQVFVNDLNSRGLSPRTVRMVHGALRTCLNRALRLGKVARNVATMIELPRNSHTERLYLGPEDAGRFLAACKSEKEWGSLFAILILTGLRPGEALGLQWGDLDGNSLRIRRALVTIPGQQPGLSSTKTGRSRVVVLGERAIQVLQEHRRRQHTLFQETDLIFSNSTGGFIDSHNMISRHFKPLLDRLKLPPIRLYDLRHSHATLMLANGEHPKIVQERLGHSSIALTLDTYSHVVPAMQEQAVTRLDSMLEA